MTQTVPTPVVSKLTLENFIAYVESGQSIAGTVDTLEVSYWGSQDWKVHCTIALAQICLLLKVKTLVFKPTPCLLRAVSPFFETLNTYIPKEGLTFLPDLREIEITCIRTLPPFFWNLLGQSRVTKLTWRDGRKSWETKFISDDVNIFLLELYQARPSPFKDNFYLQELHFAFSWEDEPISFKVKAWDGFNPTERNRFIEAELDRNRKGFKKCVDACITLLGFSRRREFSMHRDTLRIIARMIYETKYTKIWIETDADWMMSDTNRLVFELWSKNQQPE